MRAMRTLLPPLCCAFAVAAQPAPAKAGAGRGGASFDCTRAASTIEQAVCADPYLASLDGRLSRAWTGALARAGDDQRAALLQDQRTWLATRETTCADGAGDGCLRSLYALRIAVLDDVRQAPFAWPGTWRRVSGEALVEIGPALPGGRHRLAVSASAGAHAGGPAEGVGTAAGPGRLDVRLDAETGEPTCRFELRRVANQLELLETVAPFECGMPMGVTFRGRYLRDDGTLRLPGPDLLQLGLAATEADDRRIRALLGEDAYARLVDAVGLVDTEERAPGLRTFFVRGLAVEMAGALQQHAGAVRAALIDGDARVVRYWSTDPDTRAAPPAWLDAWRAPFSDLPVVLMSAPGTPRLGRSGE